MPDTAPQNIGPYRVIETLGRGGMAEVLKAYQASLDRNVAIKLLHPMVASDPQFLVRFRREAKAVAALRHPHIVQVYDFGIDGDRYYMVMEYVAGQTLKARLDGFRKDDSAMPLAEVDRIVAQVADALDYAHAQGVIHRDVKPANVLLGTQDQVILTDFGIAHMVESSRYTLTGSIGTPHYMSPEQGMGQQEDARTDVYSLGVMLYEMLVGRVPYDADTSMAVIFKHVEAPLPLPRVIRADIPAAVEQVVLKAMAKKPGDRYSTPGELSKALHAAIVSVDEKGRSPKPARHGRVSPFIFGGVVVLAIAAGLLAAGLLADQPAPAAAPTPSLTASPTPIPPSPVTPVASCTATQSPAPTYTIGPPTQTPTQLPTVPPTVQPTATLTATVTVTPTPGFKYAAPVLLEPLDETEVMGELVVLKWQPPEEPLADNEWFAVRLIFFQQGNAVYQGDRVKAGEWRVPVDFRYKADGPELRYDWFVFIEHDNGDGSATAVSPESETMSFRWE